MTSTTVFQGEFAVSAEPGAVLTAVLGSCIATCLWDSRLRLGGMNHILLPGRGSGQGNNMKYGVFAMEALINELMKNGARKPHLEARIYGGARLFENGLGIGEANALFARRFLEHEGIPILETHVGGRHARRVRFFPESGVVQKVRSREAESQEQRETERAKGTAMPSSRSGGVELF